MKTIMTTLTASSTLGQELIDPERARDAGVISQAEFDRARAGFLDGRN